MAKATTTTGVWARLEYAVDATKAIAADPYEGLERTLERLADRIEHHRPPWPYHPEEDGEQRVHELLDVPWPCPEHGAFQEVWNDAMQELVAHGLRVGRGVFGGWDDADPRLARLAWCVTRHLRPAHVVETGVARGVTTRVLLEALERNDRGRLWSIDLPPLLQHELSTETAAAVPERLHERWTLLRGSSRRMLGGLVAGLGEIDEFVHDSMHTTRNVRFELDLVWPALTSNGVALIDDVERNAATGQFLASHDGTPGIIAPSDDHKALIGCLVKRAA